MENHDETTQKKIAEQEKEIAELKSKLEDYEVVFEQTNVIPGRYYVATQTIVFPPKGAATFGIDPVTENFPDCYIKQGNVRGNIEQFNEFYEAIRRGEPKGRNSTEIRVASGEVRLYNRQFTTVYDEQNQPIYGILSLTDITEQREQMLAAEKWAYINKSLKSDNTHYYDYNMTQDVLEAIDGNSASIYPDQNERSFSGVARYVADNIIHPEERDEYLRIFDRETLLEQFRQGQTEIVTEHRRRGKDGHYFHAQGVVQLYSDPFNGDVLSVVVIKNMEDTIAQWKTKLNTEARDALNDSIPGGIIFVYNKPGHPFYSVNQRYLDYLGYTTREELEADTQGLARNIIHPDDRSWVEAAITQALKTGSQYKVDHRVLKKGGETMWVVHRGRKSTDHEGKEILICLLVDVTEIVKLQEELQAQAADLERMNRELKTLTDNVPGGVSVMKMDGKFTLVYGNSIFFEMHGYTQEQSVKELNNEWVKTIHPDDVEKMLHTVTDAKESGKIRFDHEIRLFKRDGSVIWVLIRGTVVEAGDEFYIHAVTLDITDRKLYDEMREKHEKALQAAAAAAEEATRMKSAFLANMSHEIRTPMNGVVGFAELALDDPTLSDKTRTYLNKIKMSGAGLLDIINDILDISKIEAGKMELDLVEFSIHDVFKQCETISGIKAEEKGVALYFYSEPDFWKKLIGDPTKLRQVLLNLMSNAIKFTNRGIVKLSATIEELHEDRLLLHFEVRDSGIGMTPEQLDKIFDPFTQAEAGTTRRFGGTGLGLPITKNMVELMGGELKVESAVGIGSKFSFTIPFGIADSPVDPQSGESEIVEEIVQKPIFSGEVLVCEDNPINQDVICDHLTKVGLVPTVAVNGKVGVDMVKRRMHSGTSFDLILMDIHMPIMDGLEATRYIIRQGVTTPIIALTANAMEKDRNTYLANGMSDYLAKPFRSAELWGCLSKFLTPISMVPVDSATTNVHPLSEESDDGIINRKLGLERSAGDANLYGRVWNGFLNRNTNTIAELRRSIAEGSIKDAHQIAHTLKGTAGLLGATELSKVAQEVEQALLEGKDRTSEEQLQQLEVEMNHVLKVLQRGNMNSHSGLRSPISAQQSKSETSPQKPLNVSEAIKLLDELEPLLESGNSKSGSYQDKLEEILAPLGELAKTLYEQIDDYDFDPALETARKIREQLENQK